MAPTHRVGPLLFLTEKLRLAFVTEARGWKHAYGKHMNESCAQNMNEVLDFFDKLGKLLSRPIKDLDDVRSSMAALAEIREAEIRIDMTITPIEEAYAMLNKYNLVFNDGNAERVDSLPYGWKLLKGQVCTMLQSPRNVWE